MKVIFYGEKPPILAAGDTLVCRSAHYWRGEVEKVDAIYPCKNKTIAEAYEKAGVNVYSDKAAADAETKAKKEAEAQAKSAAEAQKKAAADADKK
jgi:hypothetical protein